MILDGIDRKILSLLMKDARTSYLEVGKWCRLSGAAIHQRIRKLKSSGIIIGSQLIVNPKKLGFTTCAYIGIQVNLTSIRTHDEVYKRITQIPEIVECHHISGKYSLLLKIYTKDNEGLKNIITEKIQVIPEIIATETFISLQEGFMRQIPLTS